MPQLRSCYFCGAVGDSLREYDLAPDDAVPEGTHSAVLCSTCHEKLRRVLEPLTDGSSSEGSEDSARDPSSTQSITFGAGGAASGENGQSDGAEESHGDETALDDPASTKAPVDRDGRDDAGTDTDEDPTDGTGPGGTGDDADATGDDTTAEGGDSGPETTDDDPDVPESYYKVLRLLQNREFPMERTELTTLVTAAYDVSEPQCERVLETAIDRGVLVEDGSTLDLGRN